MAEKPQAERHGFWFRYLGLPFAKLVAGILFFVLGPTRVLGRKHVPREGGLLILSNHLADVDPILVQLACPRPIHFMAKSELFEMPVLKHVIRWFRAFPVKRGEPDRASMKRAVALLWAGEAVCIFPEGELSQEGHLQVLKPGIALIVRMAGVPAICVGLKGTNKVLPYGKVLPRPAFGGVSATWGDEKRFEPKVEATDILGWVEAELRRLTDQPQDYDLPTGPEA